MNQHATYVGQKSFRSRSIVRTHTQQADCTTWTTKWSIKMVKNRCHGPIELGENFSQSPTSSGGQGCTRDAPIV